MKKLLLLTLFCTVSATPVAASNLEQLASENRAVIKEFMDELKEHLMAGMKEGGPIKAIEVCNVKAPAIAMAQSKKHGWEVGRTSLKVRNPDNAPDAWEQAVLEKFEARKKAGEDPKTMEYYEVVTQDGKPAFRYMKAIPTAKKPCLVCHGTNIQPKLAEALDKLYPQDQARGFKAGDIRGAFTITQPM